MYVGQSFPIYFETFGFILGPGCSSSNRQTCQPSTDGEPIPFYALALEAMVPLRFQWCALEPTSIVVMWLPLVKRFQRCLGQETGCGGGSSWRALSGEMIGFMNPGILVKYHKKHYSAWKEAFESKRGFRLLPCFTFQFEQLWVDSALIEV